MTAILRPAQITAGRSAGITLVTDTPARAIGDRRSGHFGR